MRPGVCWVLLTALVGLHVASTGCGARSSSSRQAKIASVAQLATQLPNLGDLGIVACDYVSLTQSSQTRLPAPSDTLVELVGQAILSDTGAWQLQDRHNWEAVERHQVPVSLRAVLPDGVPLISRALNKTFSRNGTFVRGFIVVMQGDAHTLYFVARDLDHPLE